MPMESTVLSATHPNIGTPPLKDVSLANPVTLGIMSLTNAHAANLHVKSSMVSVSVHHQKHNGMMPLKLAHVQSILLVITVSHVLLQDNGIYNLTLVNAQHQKPNGTEPPVNAQLENMDHNVWNAQLQDIGTAKQTNACATNHSCGTETTAFAPNHISFTKADAPTVQQDTPGKRTDARSANATTRI